MPGPLLLLFLIVVTVIIVIASPFKGDVVTSVPITPHTPPFLETCCKRHIIAKEKYLLFVLEGAHLKARGSLC